jgi:predicted RNase H-like HicB family nuclease
LLDLAPITYARRMTFEVEVEREEDGRFLAEIVALPGALAYGDTGEEAAVRAMAVALRILADRIEAGEMAWPETPFEFRRAA